VLEQFFLQVGDGNLLFLLLIVFVAFGLFASVLSSNVQKCSRLQRLCRRPWCHECWSNKAIDLGQFVRCDGMPQHESEQYCS